MTLDEFWAMYREQQREQRALDGLPPLKRDVRRCGARCRDGHLCQARAVRDAEGFVRNGRCRLHGGISTGRKRSGVHTHDNAGV